MKKQMLCSFVYILCFLVVFTGCSPKNSENGMETIQNDSTEKTSTTGKYVEQDVTPSGFNGDIRKMYQLTDGKIALIGRQENGALYACTTLDGTEWEAVDTSGVSSYGKEHFTLEMSDVLFDDSGTWWVANYDTSGECHLYRVLPNGDGEEILVPVLEEESGQGGEEWMKKYIDGLYLGNDGTILMEVVNSPKKNFVQIEATSGAVTNTFSPSGFPRLLGYRDGTIYLAPAGENIVEAYTAADGKITETIALPVEPGMLDYLRGAVITNDHSLVYLLPTGIEKIALGGDMVQTVLDERSYVYATAGLRFDSFIDAGDDSYWLACEEKYGNPHVYRYVFDKDAPVVAAQTLTIWTMDDNVLLREAVSTFARTHTEFDVQVEYGHTDMDSAASDEDIIKTLNTQLLAGDAPDVLVLDGLPIQSMIQQGVLADLSGAVDNGAYYDNILNSYSVDGKAYAYPAAFQLPMVIKLKEAAGPSISDARTISELAEILSNPQYAYFGGYCHVFDILIDAYAPSVFPEGIDIDEAELRQFFSAFKTIVDGQGLNAQETDPVTDGFTTAMDDGSGAVEWDIAPGLLMYQNHSPTDARDYAAFTLPEFGEYTWMKLYKGVPQIEPLPGNAFVPKCVLGVPVGAQNEEGARRFIASMLDGQSERTARLMGLPGFLVKRNIEQEVATSHYEELKAEDIEDFVPNDPALIDWDNLIEKYTTPSIRENILYEKLYEQAKLICSGTDIDTAVTNVLQSTQLYFAERK